MTKRASRTAEYMALYRALESARPEGSRLFYDSYAHMFLHGWRRIAAALSHVSDTRHLTYRLADRLLPGARAAGVARTAYIDAQLKKILPQVSSFVLLGAGYDTRALRMPAATSLHCYELDYPETQNEKRQTLARVLKKTVNVPQFVPINFNKQSLHEALTSVGFDFTQPSCLLWEGVTNYLDPSAVDATLQEISRFAPGTILVFTYVHSDVLSHPGRFYRATELLAKLRKLGEPWTFAIDPAALSGYLAERGLTLLSDTGVADIWKQYQQQYQRRGTAIRGYEFYRIATAQVA
jgi:methyltransferase (TIGR00027 family)